MVRAEAVAQMKRRTLAKKSASLAEHEPFDDSYMIDHNITQLIPCIRMVAWKVFASFRDATAVVKFRHIRVSMNDLQRNLRLVKM